MGQGERGNLVAAHLMDSYMSPANQSIMFCVCYGPPGIGKSSWALQILMELYPHDPEEGWDNLVFRPQDFVKRVSHLIDRGERAKCIVWDDAGLWLYALDWFDPSVKAATKFLNVARTVTAGLILTTPSLRMLQDRVTTIEGVNVVKVHKVSKAAPTEREADYYRNSIAPWGRRYITNWAVDSFNVMLPDAVYHRYKPIREAYAKEARDLMTKSLERIERTVPSGIS